MPDFIEVHDWCWTCRGTGQKPAGQGGSVDCPACGADGKVFRGFMDASDLAKKDEVETQIAALDTKFDAIDVKLDAILAAVAP